MRVELTTSGGLAFFPGLSKPVVVSSDELDAEQAQELVRLVDAARFFELSGAAPSKPRPDARSYVLTIHDEGRSHTLHLCDPIEDPALEELVRFVRKRAVRRR